MIGISVSVTKGMQVFFTNEILQILKWDSKGSQPVKKSAYTWTLSKWGGGGVPRVTKTLAAWQHCCAEILAVWWTLRKISQKYTQNFFRVLHCFFLEKNLKYLCHFVAKLAQKCMFLCLKYSTNKCFVRKFSIKFGLFENFHKK